MRVREMLIQGRACCLSSVRKGKNAVLPLLTNQSVRVCFIGGGARLNVGPCLGHSGLIRSSLDLFRSPV